MVLLLNKLGGTNLEDRGDKTALSEEHTLTWEKMLDAGCIGHAVNANKTLKAAGAYENGGFTAAENYTTDVGIKSTVDLFNPDMPYVIIEATSISSISDFQINDCDMFELSTGKWVLYSDVGFYETRRAKIYKTLFYGTNGTNYRVSSTYITGLTALKSNDSRDVGKRVHQAYLRASNERVEVATNTWTGTLDDTTDNADVSSWSYLYGRCQNKVHTMYWEVAAGVVHNSLATSGSVALYSDELGTDTSVDQKTNPATCRLRLVSSSTSSTGSYEGTYQWAIMLAKGTVSWAYAGSSAYGAISYSSKDFTVDESIPEFTEATETLIGTTALFVTNGYTLNKSFSSSYPGDGSVNTAINNTPSSTLSSQATAAGIYGTVLQGCFVTKYTINSNVSGATRFRILDYAFNTLLTDTFSGTGEKTLGTPYYLENNKSYYFVVDDAGGSYTPTRDLSPSYLDSIDLNLEGGYFGGADLDSYNLDNIITETANAIYIPGQTILCNTGITIGSSDSGICLYSNQETPTGTSTTVSLTDGTNTISDIPITNGTSGVIAKGSLSGNLKIINTLNTTDTAVTPIQYGWGVYKI